MHGEADLGLNGGLGEGRVGGNNRVDRVEELAAQGIPIGENVKVGEEVLGGVNEGADVGTLAGGGGGGGGHEEEEKRGAIGNAEHIRDEEQPG